MAADLVEGTIRMRDEDDLRQYVLEGTPVIAADGSGSIIRRQMSKLPGYSAREDYLPHAYKELTIPAADDGTHAIDANSLHIWPRGDFMLIALPNPGGDFTLTLFLPNTGNNSFESLTDKTSVIAFFEEYFPDAAALIPNLCDDMLNHPLGMLGTVRCRHWHDRGNVLLLGDAAHAIVPFHGQGMNLAFEDCVLLDRIITEHHDDWPTVFARFEAEQLANANAIADMALDNYIEMRDTVRDPKFALRKALAFELEKRLPGHFIPRYSMVMFHADIPYLVAQQRGEVQGALLEEFTANAETIDDVDIDAAATAVRHRLPLIDSVRNRLSARRS